MDHLNGELNGNMPPNADFNEEDENLQGDLNQKSPSISGTISTDDEFLHGELNQKSENTSLTGKYLPDEDGFLYGELNQKSEKIYYTGKSNDTVDLIIDNVNRTIEAISKSGTGDKHYVHNQLSSSNEWIIQHNLRKFPSVTIIDSAGSNVIGEVKYLNLNTLVVSFQSAFSGRAYLN